MNMETLQVDCLNCCGVIPENVDQRAGNVTGIVMEGLSRAGHFANDITPAEFDFINGPLSEMIGTLVACELQQWDSVEA